MQEVPEKTMEFRIDEWKIEDVVKGHNAEPNAEHNPEGQSHNETHQHHTNADGPDHLEHQEVIKRVETPAEVYDCKFNENEPYTPCKQETSQLFAIAFETKQVG